MIDGGGLVLQQREMKSTLLLVVRISEFHLHSEGEGDFEAVIQVIHIMYGWESHKCNSDYFSSNQFPLSWWGVAIANGSLWNS